MSLNDLIKFITKNHRILLQDSMDLYVKSDRDLFLKLLLSAQIILLIDF